MAENERSMTRRVIWFALAVVVVALVALALRPQPVEIDVAEAMRTEMRVTLDEEGETRVRERFVVSAPVSGQILRIELEPGDSVVAGETVLATFQPVRPALLDARTKAETTARRRAAEARLGRVRAERSRVASELEFARSELRRIERLAGEQIVSEEALDAARLNVDTGQERDAAAEFAVRTAQFDLAQIRATMDPTYDDGTPAPIVMRSPIDGVVLRRLHESSAVVAAGEPLLEVADPTRLEIVSDYLSEDAVRIDPGMAVRIEDWGGSEVLHGEVRRIEPSGFTKISALGVEEQRVNVIIDFVDGQGAWQALGDGFRVEVRVVSWESADALVVPTSCLFRHEGQWALYAVHDDRAVLTPVEVGARNGLQAEILSGLDEGEAVVLYPSDSVADGVRVRPR
ncbi:MAG: efflux RND transporter periplasmic adaptor subunit [Acidobacteriota bacterium]|nr:efflux RND transporter periplasmic adaptor subunit [Acidobacteriota bacterium]MDH3784281.1 efflux RND transporter periplasmic adaptor subunit [Acidobacteriota bacterium]